jgi:hypothetical protein
MLLEAGENAKIESEEMRARRLCFAGLFFEQFSSALATHAEITIKVSVTVACKTQGA